jgi:hypothetical protein
MELVAPAQLLRLIAIKRHVQRAALREARLRLRLLLELPGEARPAGERCEVEGQKPLLAPRRLPDGREHARGDTGGSGGGTVPLQDAHAGAALGGSAGAGEPDHAASDEDRVESIVRFCLHHPPCAGITRIRFGRSAALQPPSQPMVGSRYVSIVPPQPLI